MSELLDKLPWDLSVGWPLALWGLLACPLLILAAVRSRFPISRGRRFMVTTARVLAAALLVLAVADFRVGLPTHELAVATVLDSSASVTEAERTQVRNELRALEQAHPEVTWVQRAAGDEAGAPGAGRRDDRPLSLGAELQVALARLPRERVRRILLYTDGLDDGPALSESVRAAHAEGAEVSVVPIGDRPPMDRVALSGLGIPRLARAGDRVDVAVETHASAQTPATVVIHLDGEEVAREQVVAPVGDGSARVALELPDEEGVHEVEVSLLSDSDAVAGNNVWRTLIHVSEKPRVWLMHDPTNGPPLLAAVLTDAGMRVDVTPLTAAPSSAQELEPYALAIVDEAELGDLSDLQQEAIRSWVEDAGGGLITITGGNPVRRTPQTIRELEPITVPPAIPEPRPLELVLVIDRSGSMSGEKMSQARRAGVAAVQALRADARVGVVAFSGAADRVMAPVGMDQAESVINFIGAIQAGGGTNIGAALAAANRVMSNDPRYIHHVILLSDGVSAAQPAYAAAQALAGRGVSISAITLGPYSEVMAQIAQIGRGRYHVVNNAGALPSLFVAEAQYRQPPAHRRVTFPPREITHLEMLDGVDFSTAPPLNGHALSATRRGATTVLGASGNHPLLSHWHRGLGQVATWTSATNGNWVDGFRSWGGYRDFWAKLAEGMFRSRTIEPPGLFLEEHPTVPGLQILTVTGTHTAAEPRPIVRMHRERALNEEVPLVEVGPGVWQSEIPEGEGFLITARMPRDPEPTVAVGIDRPYPTELARFGVEPEGIARLAVLGGGEVLDRPQAVLDQVPETLARRSLRTAFLIAALALYLLGLLLLRIPDRTAISPSLIPARRRSMAPRRRSMPPQQPSGPGAPGGGTSGRPSHPPSSPGPPSSPSSDQEAA